MIFEIVSIEVSGRPEEMVPAVRSRADDPAEQERPAVSRKDPGKAVRLEPSLAGRDVESGDLACAAVRVSNVLMSDPALPDAHETLARLADHPRDGRDLFPMTSPLVPGHSR